MLQAAEVAAAAKASLEGIYRRTSATSGAGAGANANMASSAGFSRNFTPSGLRGFAQRVHSAVPPRHDVPLRGGTNPSAGTADRWMRLAPMLSATGPETGRPLRNDSPAWRESSALSPWIFSPHGVHGKEQLPVAAGARAHGSSMSSTHTPMWLPRTSLPLPGTTSRSLQATCSTTAILHGSSVVLADTSNSTLPEGMPPPMVVSSPNAVSATPAFPTMLPPPPQPLLPWSGSAAVAAAAAAAAAAALPLTPMPSSAPSAPPPIVFAQAVRSPTTPSSATGSAVQARRCPDSCAYIR
eukprot:NODE_6742_length_1643_cov_3.126649.p1 GENE.NODE_6742_length_1643_cov_3.126649~~NODE_6742_length_1643_cov_3.126649.p1  ORF type:complete len:311 (+),score=74.10 NODE_6742_length_1643_cov_3.126649:43-933(+)